MRRFAASALLLTLAACGPGMSGGTSDSGTGGTSSGSTSGSGSTGSTGTCADSWDSYGQAFFSQYCSSCHGSFSEQDVASSAAVYRNAISSGAMPENDSLDDADRARIVTWLDCQFDLAANGSTTGTNGDPPP